jgi:hypothetical protein
MVRVSGLRTLNGTRNATRNFSGLQRTLADSYGMENRCFHGVSGGRADCQEYIRTPMLVVDHQQHLACIQLNYLAIYPGITGRYPQGYPQILLIPQQMPGTL